MARVIPWAAACCGFCLLLACGCASKGDDDVENDGRCVPPCVVLVEDILWSAGGHELLLRVEDAEGRPWEGEPASLSLELEGSGSDSSVAIAPAELEPGVTLLLVRPGSPEARLQYEQAIRAFIAARPPTERIALWAWGESLVQATDFTTRRERLNQQVDRIYRVSGDPLAVPEAFEQALSIVRRVEAPNMRGPRNLVLVAGDSVSAEMPGGPQEAVVQFVVPGRVANELGSGRAVAFDDAGELEAALLQVSERLDAHAEKAFYRIGICSDTSDEVGAELSAGSGRTLDILLGPSLPEEREGECDSARIVESVREGVHTVRLMLDQEQLAVYEQRLQDIVDLVVEYQLPTVMGQLRLITEGYGTAKDRFDLRVALAPSGEGVQATARFRGQNALFCNRKSYTVNLSGPETRHFGENSGANEFYLIAMCQDPTLFKGFMGYTVYREYDLFPLLARYVELRFNEQTQGVYLLVEKREEELLRDSGRLRGVVRRRYEGLVEPGVEYAAGDPQALLAAYDELNAVQVPDDELADYLAERMDIDQYLRWVAINSLLQNADTLDEVLFISTESIDAGGRPSDYFRLMAWDPEDIQGACAPVLEPFQDPHGLVFCQEAAFERDILARPGIYARYVSILKELLQELTPERYRAVLDAAGEQLFPLLERDGVAAAMTLPGASDAASARALVEQRMAQSVQQLSARREELGAAVEAYESTD